MRAAFLALSLFAMASAETLRSLNVEAIIEEVNNAQTTWKAGHNFDLDTPLQSIQSLLGVINSTEHGSLEKKIYSGVELPEEFDARKQWPRCPTISNILDQSHCGSCWAVSVASAFSDRVCIASNGTFTMPLSAENLLACCKNTGGCHGWVPAFAWEYIVETGLVTGGDYLSNVGCQPYTMQPCDHSPRGPLPKCNDLPPYETPTCKKKCYNSKYEKSYESDVHKAKKAYMIDGEKSIQEDIMKYGSVVAGFVVYLDFTTYKTGVYQHVSGGIMGGHAVRVIGWGTENGTPYWLVANSWNSGWGDGGHFKILRGSNEADFEAGVVAGLA